MEFGALSMSSSYSMDCIGVSAHHGWREYITPVMGQQTIEFILVDMPTMCTGEEHMDVIEKRQSANEWLCDWCGSPNDRKEKLCAQCGGARSFIYE